MVLIIIMQSQLNSYKYFNGYGKDKMFCEYIVLLPTQKGKLLKYI